MKKKEKVLVLGCGVSGQGAIKLSVSLEKDTFVYDDKLEVKNFLDKEKFKEVKIVTKRSILEDIQSYKWIVKSPGIDNRDSFIKEIRSHNSNIISELDFGYLHLKNNPKIIGITGTNGKSTTSSLVYYILKTSKLDVSLVGNIGYSFSEAIASENEKDFYVIEVSSFQLDDSICIRFDIAALLNISPNHLDRYKSFYEYVASKKKMEKMRKSKSSFIFNSKNEFLSENVKENIFSDRKNFLDNVGKYSSNDFLFGEHNEDNIAAASTICEALGVSEKVISEAVSSFSTLDHRLQYVRELDEVMYYNDSKSTTIESTKAALKSFSSPLVWIVGGHDKGNDYNSILDIVKKRVYAIITLALDNTKILNSFADKFLIYSSKSMQEAVEVAQSIAWPGMTVLLSPACASYDLFKDYQDRGNQFVKEIYKLTKLWT